MSKFYGADLLKSKYHCHEFYEATEAMMLNKLPVDLIGRILGNDRPEAESEGCEVLKRHLKAATKNWKRLWPKYAIDQFVPPLKTRPLHQMSQQNVKLIHLRAVISFWIRTIFGQDFLGDDNVKQLADRMAACVLHVRYSEIVLPPERLLSVVSPSSVPWVTLLPPHIQASALRAAIDIVSDVIFAVVWRHFYFHLNNAGFFVVFRIDVWDAIRQAAFVKHVQDRQLVRLDGPLAPEAPFVRLRFLVKKHGLRPIESRSKEPIVSKKEKFAHKIVNFLLTTFRSRRRQDVVFSIKSPKTFTALYHLFLQKTKNRQQIPSLESAEVHYFKTDVKNCFPSMDWKLLDEALHFFMGSEDVEFAVCTYSRRKFVEGKMRVFSIVVVDFRRSDLASHRGNNAGNRLLACEYVTGSELRTLIRDVLLLPVVFEGVAYAASRGVHQGISMSSSLCDLYLSYLEHKLLRGLSLWPEVLAMRYVDDYFVVATNAGIVETFIARLFSPPDPSQAHLETAKRKTQATDGLASLKHLSALKKAHFIPRTEGVFSWCGFAIFTNTACMSIDAERFGRTRAIVSIPANLPTAPSHEIALWLTRKVCYRLHTKLVALRSTAKRSSNHRRALVANLVRVVRRCYLIYFKSRIGFDAACLRETTKLVRRMIRRSLRPRRKRNRKYPGRVTLNFGD